MTPKLTRAHDPRESAMEERLRLAMERRWRSATKILDQPPKGAVLVPWTRRAMARWLPRLGRWIGRGK